MMFENWLFIFQSLTLVHETLGNTMVNCAACAYVKYDVTSFQCGVTCNVVSDPGNGINITSLNEQVRQQKNEIEQLKQAVTYSFSVKQTSTITIDDDPIAYNEVSLNIGGAYNPVTGVFTAPMPGVYFFSSYAHGGNNGFMYIKHNDAELCKHWLSGKSWVHTGCTALANLTVGDTVKVTGDSSNTASPYISNGMGFNGHLVQRYW